MSTVDRWWWLGDAKSKIRFHLFVCDVNLNGNEDFWFKRVSSRFSCKAPAMERLSQDPPQELILGENFLNF